MPPKRTLETTKIDDSFRKKYEYGFRKGKSILDAVALILSTVRKAILGAKWKRCSKKNCLVASIDIKNAFNKLYWDVIKMFKRVFKSFKNKGITTYFTYIQSGSVSLIFGKKIYF